MNPETLRELLATVASGAISVDQAIARLRDLPFESLDFARIDHHRTLRCGVPEVIFGQGKTPAQVAAIFERLAARGQNVLATRVSPEAAESVTDAHPEAEYHALARVVSLRQQPAAPTEGRVAICAAGTADLPVAEEARLTAELLDQRVSTYYDVGVAGLHRLLGELPEIREARVVIAVAGMEGALPSVLGGLVDIPLIAVPTSVGYGAQLQGMAPLLTMLNSCASGVSVVNIDNGFGAAYQAALINAVADRAANQARERTVGQ